MRYGAHFRLAQSLNKNLYEVMGWKGPLTHRQFLMWNHWYHNDFNNPSRTDFYLMQIAQEIVRGRVKHPRSVKLESFKLEFKTKKKQPTDNKYRLQASDKERAQFDQWVSCMTAPIAIMEDGKQVGTIVPPIVLREKLKKELQGKIEEVRAERIKKKPVRVLPERKVPTKAKRIGGRSGNSTRARGTSSKHDG